MKIAIKTTPRRLILLDAKEIYYIESDSGDTLVRTRRKTRHRSIHRLTDWERQLRKAGGGFIRIHRSYLVNLDNVREIRLRHGDDNDWELKLDPPVNAVLPVGKTYLPQLEKALGLK